MLSRLTLGSGRLRWSGAFLLHVKLLCFGTAASMLPAELLCLPNQHPVPHSVRGLLTGLLSCPTPAALVLVIACSRPRGFPCAVCRQHLLHAAPKLGHGVGCHEGLLRLGARRPGVLRWGRRQGLLLLRAHSPSAYTSVQC